MGVRNLKHRGLRSWLTMLGIFISIATIFTLISISIGLQGAVAQQFQVLGSDKFFIMPKTLNLGVTENVILTEDDLDTIKKVNGVKDYSYITMGTGEVKYKGQIKYLMIAGMPLDHLDVYTEISSFKFTQGSFLKGGDVNVIVLGNNFELAKIFKQNLTTRDTLEINGKDFKIKGVMEPIGNPQDDQNILMPLDDFRDLFNVPNRIDQIIVQVQPGQNVLDVANRVEEKLRKSKGETEKTQDFSISTPEDLLESFNTILNIITAFLAGIAAISLIVGGIGIANTMYTSVIERTKEIGIMKAIGAKNSDVLLIFLIEAGLLGLMGGIIGVLLGMGLSWIIVYIAAQALGTNLFQAAFPLWLILSCLGFGFLIGAISGTLPALQASKTNVVDALRYE
ncbi:MAG: ABC transporter permease [Nanoarchaeota archaeon]|nr:ABC transporter permease [Nanoarchaeota archaeon]